MIHHRLIILPFDTVRPELLTALSKKMCVCVCVGGNTLLYIGRKTLQLVICSLLNLVILDRKFYKPDFVRFLCDFDFVLTLLDGFSMFGRLKGVLPFVIV